MKAPRNIAQVGPATLFSGLILALCSPAHAQCRDGFCPRPTPQSPSACPLPSPTWKAVSYSDLTVPAASDYYARPLVRQGFLYRQEKSRVAPLFPYWQAYRDPLTGATFYRWVH
jgi:hypothetical protein